MLATVTENSFQMKEIYRFPNAIMGIHGKYYWDVYAIFDNLKKSIAAARDLGVKLDSIGIDTWGCDFGYIAADGTLLGLPRAYRDQYTVGTPEKTYEIVPRKELYAHTGIQIMNFNSIFQIFKAKEALKISDSHSFSLPICVRISRSIRLAALILRLSSPRSVTMPFFSICDAATPM